MKRFKDPFPLFDSVASSIFDLGIIVNSDKKSFRFDRKDHPNIYYEPYYGRCNNGAMYTYACSRESKSIAFLFKVEEKIPLFITLDGKADGDYDLYLAPARNRSPLRIQNSVAYAVNSTEYVGKNDTIFSELEPGEYYLEVRQNENSLQEGSRNDFKLKFDSKLFIETTKLPDDTYFDAQWSLFGNPDMEEILTNQDFSYILPNYDIGAPEAWKYNQKAGDVVVAVIDSGVDIQHPDLDDNIWVNPNIKNSKFKNDLHGWNFYEGSNDVSDSGSHGTHVAGIIAAEWGNQMGIAGVAENATIMPIAAGLAPTFAPAIRYAVDNGAKVINYSQGKYYKFEPDRVYEYLDHDGQLLEGAPRFVRQMHKEYFMPLQYARQNSVNVVFAGGNENSLEETLYGWEGAGNAAQTFAPSVGFAKYFDNVINVGSSNALGEAASYSNYGGLIDIYAPGGDSSSSGSLKTNILSTVPSSACTDGAPCLYEESNSNSRHDSQAKSNGFYKYLSGTSMAAPVVAGSIALLRGLYPCMSASDVNQLLLETAFDNPKIITNLGETAKMLSLGIAADAANSIHKNKKFKLGKGCQGRKHFAASNRQPIRAVTNGFLNGTLRDDVIKPQDREKPITIFSLDGDDKVDLRTIRSAAAPSYISGGKGSDEIICSKGVDRLIYNGTEESNLANADIITNFGVEDQIDLSAILKGALRKPKFIGTDHYKIFTQNEPGSLQIRATERLVGIDENGDGISEFRLFFDKPLDFAIDQSNFIL